MYRFAGIHYGQTDQEKEVDPKMGSLLFVFARNTYPFMKRNLKEEFKMMNFVEMTLCIMVAMILASIVTTVIMMTVVMNKKVIKWYMKKVTKMSMELAEDLLEETDL
jgi:hypothetical protein